MEDAEEEKHVPPVPTAFESKPIVDEPQTTGISKTNVAEAFYSSTSKIKATSSVREPEQTITNLALQETHNVTYRPIIEAL